MLTTASPSAQKHERDVLGSWRGQIRARLTQSGIRMTLTMGASSTIEETPPNGARLLGRKSQPNEKRIKKSDTSGNRGSYPSVNYRSGYQDTPPSAAAALKNLDKSLEALMNGEDMLIASSSTTWSYFEALPTSPYSWMNEMLQQDILSGMRLYPKMAYRHVEELPFQREFEDCLNHFEPSRSTEPGLKNTSQSTAVEDHNDFEDSEIHARGSIVGGYDVLYLATSLSFSINLHRLVDGQDKFQAGYPYLSYSPGEIFDIVGEKGELWLAIKQNDSSNLVGWIWSKHLFVWLWMTRSKLVKVYQKKG
ncbi:hypothetical protein VTL71DRAFT_13875 [Oculimacula yallundae]|uniref:Uncharacterized protein n=1 Tax=Oculimacula yallundae TaxID=86028 RepID=A0ABR4CP54_9HELO